MSPISKPLSSTPVICIQAEISENEMAFPGFLANDKSRQKSQMYSVSSGHLVFNLSLFSFLNFLNGFLAAASK